ncbi:PBP1A family penicillin-binding protein [Paenibacillus sp. JCM 10914]|uniref:transglycosylase domain-containing protein n=1 Tax=Paenibacillus sp. JCM 10914 TaxID=1236974 RepID=UPI0003CC2A0F|nr:PBP1A family penicillin-binding protein [Paenibacillus sp. JCM 10914]GAE09288.1 multimodular transpeptidase-transglycosylase [Paenibacillus sp. JCM 10914]
MPGHQPPSAKRKRRFVRLASLLFALLGVTLIAGGILLVYLFITPLPVAETSRYSRLLDSQGDLIATFSTNGHMSEQVNLADISPLLVEATLSVEDRKFYDHPGFDIKGMARALLVNLRNMDRTQGASTLTQQLARNLYLSHEKTWTRKLKEAKFTAQLEMKYTKEQILEMYLNEIYYGHGAYGIESASLLYFGKSAKNLTLAESAMLAGIPKGPTYYSPYNHMDNAVKRQRLVLNAMVETGFITQAEADKATSAKLAILPQDRQENKIIASYFRDYVRGLVMKELNITEKQLEQGGLNIYTTLDPRAQQAAEEAVAAGMDITSELETGLVSIDPRNGHIKAMVGGKNYRHSQFNHVLATTRQPGSAFKPIMYLTAIASKEMTSRSVFNSQPTLFHYDDNRKTYQPSNFGDKYLGEIPMREAIAASDNIYAVNTIMQIGPEKVAGMAKNMGITSPLEPVPSLALGTSPVSPMEMASAYAVLANNGVRVAPIAVLSITDAAGRRLYTAPAPAGEQVVEPAAAYVLTRMMEGVFETGGTGNRVSSIMKRPVAGKTGTTDTDAWLVGYTPELATAVWVGYDKGRAITKVDGRRAAPIFAEYTEKALENVPPKIFPIPDDVISTYIDPKSGKLAGSDCPDKTLEVFVKGTEPTEYCDEHNHGEPSKKAEPAETSEKQEEHSWWQDFKRWWVE